MEHMLSKAQSTGEAPSLSALKAERDVLTKRIQAFSPEAQRYNEMLRKRETLSKECDRCRTMVKEAQLRAYAEKENQGTTVKTISPALLPSQPVRVRRPRHRDDYDR